MEISAHVHAVQLAMLFAFCRRNVGVAHLSSMEMFDVGPTSGASVAKVSRTEVPWVGSTSGATVANVSNIDVFEVAANIVLLS